MTAPYIPDRGDLVWLQLAAGGQNPVFVVSPRTYNQVTGLLLACPFTSQVKNYPFEVAIAEGFLDGVVLADQVKTLDWQARNAGLIIRTSPETTAAVLNKLKLLTI